MVTCVPVIVVLRLPLLPKVGLQDGGRQDLPSVKLFPKMATIVPGATALEPGAKLAPLTTAPGGNSGGGRGFGSSGTWSKGTCSTEPETPSTTTMLPLVRIAWPSQVNSCEA